MDRIWGKIMEGKEYDINKSKNDESLGSWLRRLVIYVIIALILRFFVFNITLVDGKSMFPTLDDGDRLITEKISLNWREVKRGDILVIHAPDKVNQNYIKRVVAVAGDRIELIDGKVYLNGEVLNEKYVVDNPTHPYRNISSWDIEEGQVFVMGDNRGASNDSRSFGPIDVNQVMGVSIFRLFPFSKFGILN